MTKILTQLSSALPKMSFTRRGKPSVATAYLTQPGLAAFVDALGEEAMRGSRWVLDLNPEFIAAGSTDLQAVRRLLDLGAEVRSLARLHAKLYLLPMEGSLILGSANLTGGGLDRNHEIVLWTDDADLTSRASEIFEGWWSRGETINLERCDELRAEAEEIWTRDIVLTQLTELGAFVTITSSTPDVRQQRTIRWVDIGVPKPDGDDIRPAPPTLRLWPQKVRRGFERVKEDCHDWLRAKAVEQGNRLFLARELFPDLARRIGAANRSLHDLVDAITEDDWITHRRSLEHQVRAWLTDIANEQRRDEEWIEERVDAIMDLPRATKLGEGLSIAYDLEVPHPDSGDLSEIHDAVARAMERKRTYKQMSFRDF